MVVTPLGEAVGALLPRLPESLKGGLAGFWGRYCLESIDSLELVSPTESVHKVEP